MQEGASEPERLNPRRFIDYLKRFVINKGTVLDEVFVRRAISALFFALFNYWGLKIYVKGKREDGPYGDSFRLQTFFEDLLSNGLDYAVYPIFLYRVSADHYVLNPTRVVLLSRPWKGTQENVEINYNVLVTLLDLAYDILEYLEKY